MMILTYLKSIQDPMIKEVHTIKEICETLEFFNSRRIEKVVIYDFMGKEEKDENGKITHKPLDF